MGVPALSWLGHDIDIQLAPPLGGERVKFGIGIEEEHEERKGITWSGEVVEGTG